jgi:TolB-like protein
MLGEDEKAQFHVREILRLNPKYSIKNYAMTNPFKDRAILDRDTSALRKAGLPEHPPLKLPDKPSIAVLPFVNMSGDPEQEYFSDGLTDELIGDLAKISGILVISRNSAFTYKGKQVKIAQIARELNVRYVLEGSVQKSGDRVRIRSQLIEGQTDHHLWAESYDGVLNDIFDLQDKITSKIVSALKVKLSVGEQELVDRKDTENIKAYDTFLKGWSYYRRNTPEDWGKAISHFVNAVELDPDYNRAYEAIALIYWRYTRTLRPSFYQESELNVNFFEARARAREYLKLARRKPGSIYFRVEASMALYRRQYAKALTEAEHAVDLDPNDVDGIYTLAYILLAIGKTDRAVELINKGMRLDPNNIAGPLYLLGITHFAKGQLKETVSMIERALIHNPELPRPAPILPAALAHLGQVSKAKSTLENIKKDGTANFNFNTIMFNFPFQNPEVLHRLADGIRKAGLPAVDFKYYKFLPEERLDEDDIKNLIFGQKVTAFWLQKGARLWIERTEDGHARLSMVPGLTNNYYDSGQSWIEGDMLCDQWQFLKGGLKHCMSVFRNPEGTHKMKNEYIAVSDFDFQLISPVD